MPRHPRDPDAQLGDEEDIESSQVVPLLYLCLAILAIWGVGMVIALYYIAQEKWGFRLTLPG